MSHPHDTEIRRAHNPIAEEGSSEVAARPLFHFLNLLLHYLITRSCKHHLYSPKKGSSSKGFGKRLFALTSGSCPFIPRMAKLSLWMRLSGVLPHLRASTWVSLGPRTKYHLPKQQNSSRNIKLAATPISHDSTNQWTHQRCITSSSILKNRSAGCREWKADKTSQW